MNVRLQRRMSFEIRRDAAQQLPGGRVIYDALFSRWGLQAYPGGVEFRPAEEVFDAPSMASGDFSPGVLLHPDANYGTDFGQGTHQVRGVIAGPVTAHADGIHTAGQLMVWDGEWNDQIASAATSELSVGFTIDPDLTPGRAPADAPGADEHGLDYVSVQRDMLWDHIAGVPEGNAGTAKVVIDARSQRATRRALADIATMRMDARPLHFDLGAWPRRQDDKDSTMDPQKLLKQKLDAIGPKATPRQILDAWIDVYGESDDPAMQAVAAALAGISATPAPAPVAAAPTEPVVDADEDEEEKPAEEEEGESRSDAIARVEADRWSYADALELARRCNGSSFTGLGKDGRADRKDSAKPMTLDALRLAVVKKADALAGARLGRMDAAHLPAALAYAYEQARETLDEAAKTGHKLAAAINSGRQDAANEAGAFTEKLVEIQDTLKAANVAATNNIRGMTPPTQPPA